MSPSSTLRALAVLAVVAAAAAAAAPSDLCAKALASPKFSQLPKSSQAAIAKQWVTAPCTSR